MWKDVLLCVLLLTIAGGIIWYLVSARKRGQTCIGCPHAKQCGSKFGCGCDRKDVDSN